MTTETEKLRPAVAAIIATCLPMPGARNPYRAYEFAKRRLKAVCRDDDEYERACRVYVEVARL